MDHIADIIRRHGYGLFVTALVLGLGAASVRLRDGGEVSSETSSRQAVPPPVTGAPAATASPEPERRWRRPVSGGVLTEYSVSEPAWNAAMECWQCHTGVDLAARADETVLAAADGAVSAVRRDMLLGLTVEIDHGGGWIGEYASLSASDVTPGQRVRAGDAIGRAGSSAASESLMGDHLHFALTRDGLPEKPSFLP